MTSTVQGQPQPQQTTGTPVPPGGSTNPKQTKVSDLSKKVQTAQASGAGGSGGCNFRFGFHVVLVALAIITAVAGALALVVYLGELQVTLTKIGTLSQTAALYATFVGFGVAFLSVVALLLSMCFKNANATLTQPRFWNSNEAQNPPHVPVPPATQQVA